MKTQNNGLMSLVKRNIRLYLRHPANIMWSLLTVIILFALHFIVFRNMSVNGFMANVDYEGMRNYYTWLVDSLMFAAVIPLAAVSITLITLAQMVEDKSKRVFNDLMVSPLSNRKIMASYLVSSFIISFVLLLGLILVFWIFLFATSGISFTFVQLLLILSSAIVAMIFANIFMLLALSFIKTNNGVSAMGTAVGTGLGFLGGAYVPIGVLGNTMGTIFGFFPFLQMTVLTRQAFLYNLPDNLPPVDGRFNGFELWIGNTNVPLWGVGLMLAGITLALFAGLLIRFARMKKKG